MSEVVRTFCRACINHCSLEVVVSGDTVLEIRGNPDNPVYAGYSCVKGRSQGARLRDPHRITRPLVRVDGELRETCMEEALDVVATGLGRIRERHGPQAVAAYAGTMAMISTAPTAFPFYTALLDGLGTDRRFDPNTIDKGGKQTAASFLGRWGAPSQGFDSPEAILLVGINPWTTHTGFPAGSPKRWIADQLERGCRLIVIDPRETQLAQRADWFLQPAPGHDVALLAAMIRVVVDEELYDREFVTTHVRGLDELRRSLATVDIRAVATSAGVSPDDLIASARCYAGAGRGYTMAGTGPNMSGSGTLLEYLVLVLETLCGRWLRAGEPLQAAPTLLPVPEMRAQAYPPDPDWGTGEALRVRGLRPTRAGMPTAALTDEILTPGDGQVRALLSWGGNPAVAFPDQARTTEALRSLDLFVQVDPWRTESARLADVVLPPTLPLEVPSTTVFMDALSMRGTGYGLGTSHAQYGPAAVTRPAEADVLEDWQIFHGLMSRLGLPMRVRPFGMGPASAEIDVTDPPPDTDALLDLLLAPGRVSLDELRATPGGACYPDPSCVVLPAHEGWEGRLDIGSSTMLEELSSWFAAPRPSAAGGGLHLVCRRENDTYNTSPTRVGAPKSSGMAPNPAYLNPVDLEELGLQSGDAIVIANDTGRVRAVVAADPHLRQGVVSMAFGHGSATDPDSDPVAVGTSPSRLVRADGVFDRYTGQPRMTALPVRVIPDRHGPTQN